MRALLLSSIALFMACGGTGSGFGKDGGADGATDDSGNTTDGGGDGGVIFGDSGGSDGGGTDSGGTSVDFVYSHSPSELYKVDPIAKTMSLVGGFTGFTGSDILQQVIDIAIDANSNGFATTFGGVYKLDLKTAKLTLVKAGTSYPNSLSFVPKGTVDPNVEALVGYGGNGITYTDYIRIDTTSGNISTIKAGALTGGMSSSGDIVSVTNGGTFLTVNGGNCADCLIQIDPKTGSMIQSYGNINHANVWGLAFWAGTAYGFDDAGELFSISWINNALVTNIIPTTSGLQFWGAGSTTSAPPKDSDGGGLPVN